jgi:hypothetical protein
VVTGILFLMSLVAMVVVIAWEAKYDRTSWEDAPGGLLGMPTPRTEEETREDTPLSAPQNRHRL